MIDGYTNFLGDVDVRKELANKLSGNGWDLNEDDVYLVNGGSMTLYYSIFSMCNKGDKVLLPRPGFPLMHSFAQFLGVETVWYSLKEDDAW